MLNLSGYWFVSLWLLNWLRIPRVLLCENEPKNRIGLENMKNKPIQMTLIWSACTVVNLLFIYECDSVCRAKRSHARNYSKSRNSFVNSTQAPAWTI